MRTAIACSVLLATCAMDKPLERVDVPMTLAEMPGLELYFMRYLSDRLWNPGGNAFGGHLYYDRSELVDKEAGIDGCAQLDDTLTASINGIPIPITSHGRWPEGFPNEACFQPSLTIHAIPDELKVDRATLIIADSSRTITAELGNTFLPRTAVPLGADDWHFQPGQTVEVQISPASDLANATPSVTFLGPTDPPQDHVEFDLGYDQIGVNGDVIDFTLPDRELEGTMFIELHGGNIDGPCDVPCHLYGGQRVYHDAIIAP